jgi:replicative DNA helicase
MAYAATISSLPQFQPYNSDAEQLVLAAILRNNDLLPEIASVVDSSMFFDPVHRRIFDTIQKKLESGADYLDPTTLQGYLQEPLANGLVPAEYVKGLYEQQVSPKQAKAYAGEIRNQYFKRELISIGEGMAIAAREAAPHEPAENLIARFENAIAELKPQANGHSIFGTMRTAGHGAFKNAEISYKAAGIPDGVVGRSTGFPVLDDAIGGLQSPDLVVIGGRPGMGKTALATNIAVNVAGQLAQGEGIVAFVSLEMSKEQVAHRVISDKANVAGWKFRRGKVDQNDMERYAAAKYDIDNLPLHFVDKSGMNVGEIRSSLRQLQKEHGLVLVVVDYIQIIAGATDKDSQYRYSLVTAAVAALKQMAKEFKVPVIALSQLSRGVDARDDKRPSMSDLKESGGIEQDADTIMLLYREEYYLRRQEPRKGTMQWEKWRSKLQPVEGIAEVIVAKNRHGPESTVLMGFEASYTRFVNDVPQRDERPDPDQEERRIRGVGKRAADAMFYLKDLIDVNGIRVQMDGLVKVQQRGVPLETWENRISQSLELTENDMKRYLNSVIPELERADLIKIRDHEGQRYVWLTSKGEVWR